MPSYLPWSTRSSAFPATQSASPSALRLRPLALACALFAAGPGAAFAAEDAPVDEHVQTVKVTGETTKDSYSVRDSASATRLDLTLRETPQSVSTVTRAKLDDFKLNSISDMLGTVPGVTVEAVETDRVYYTARGFDITNFQYDSVGIPFVFGNVTGDFDTALYERVDVVRGANGLLSSTGNPSATVNFVRKRPGNKLAAQADLTLGRWGNKRLDVDVTLPLSENWAARLVLARDQGDSYLDRYALKKTVASVIVEGSIGANDKLAAGHTYQKSASTGNMWGALPLYYTDGTPTAYPRSANTGADWSFQDATVNSTFAEWTHGFANGWSGKATVTYNRSPNESELFFVSGLQDRATGLGLSSYTSAYDSIFKQTLADASVGGKFDLGGRRHDLSFGAAWSESKVDSRSASGPDTGTPLPGNAAVDGSYPRPAFGAGNTAGGYTDTRKNAFVAARWNLADDWKLLTGANHVKVDTRGSSYGTSSYRSASKTTPYAGLVYDINPALSAYASYSSIFNAQSEMDVNRQLLAPVEGSTRELGLKSELLDGRVQLSGAVFKARQTNTAELGGYLPSLDAWYRGVEAESQGVELELTGQLSKQWQASVGFTQMSMEGNEGQDVRTFIPRRTLRTATTYRFASVPQLKVGASVNWQSRIYIEDATALVRQGGYAVVGLMARYDINPHVSVSANLDNVTDKTYLKSLFWNQSFYAAPRNASVSVNWTY